MTLHDSEPPVIVVGASTRAFAASARRAGWSVHAADLYADADLRAVAAEAVRVPTGPDLPWPVGVEGSVRAFPAGPWCYTGAIENHPDLVDRLARERPLAGNAGERLTQVRDPVVLGRVLAAAGLAYPHTFVTGSEVPTDGSFVVKPRASAGGRGVARWRGGPSPAGRVWQRYVPGRTWAAVFAIDAHGPRLFGVSRQLVGRRWCGARGFAYCGSVDVSIGGLPPWFRRRLDRLGAVLAGDFGLIGLVGADLVVDRAGTMHVIEINPRPTASAELVERATGRSLAATHLTACGVSPPAGAAPPDPVHRPANWAKAVVFASETVVFTPAVAATLLDIVDAWRVADGGVWPAVADVPVTGTPLNAGGPVITVFAAAGDDDSALRSLRRRVAMVRAILRGVVSPPSAVAAAPPPPPRGRTA